MGGMVHRYPRELLLMRVITFNPAQRSRVKVKKDIHKNNVGRARIEPATSRVLAAVRQMRLGRFTLNQVALSVLMLAPTSGQAESN